MTVVTSLGHRHESAPSFSSRLLRRCGGVGRDRSHGTYPDRRTVLQPGAGRGHLYRAQQAADAAALAGATQLRGETDLIDKATKAAQGAVGGSGVGLTDNSQTWAEAAPAA